MLVIEEGDVFLEGRRIVVKEQCDNRSVVRDNLIVCFVDFVFQDLRNEGFGLPIEDDLDGCSLCCGVVKIRKVIRDYVLGLSGHSVAFRALERTFTFE